MAGCATGATHLTDVEEAARFIVEVAKDFTCGKCSFYDKDEYEKILELYGDLRHSRKSTGNQKAAGRTCRFLFILQLKR